MCRRAGKTSSGSPWSSQPVLGALDETVAGEAAQRGRHRRAPRADERRQRAVRERERQPDALGRDAPPALGERPQEHEEPVVDPRELRDRELERQAPRAPHVAAAQCAGEHRPARGRDCHPRVEQRDAGRLVDVPDDAERERVELDVVLRRAQHVAGAEELGRRPPGEEDLAGHDALEHEQAERRRDGPPLVERLPRGRARACAGGRRRCGSRPRGRPERGPRRARDRLRAAG